MKIKKLQKLQKHLRTLSLVKPRTSNERGLKVHHLPKTKQDKTRFSINCFEFSCGMPACVAGHAMYIFSDFSNKRGWFKGFCDYFNLNYDETNHICSMFSYFSDPTPGKAAQHIQDVIDGKFKEKV